MLEQICEAVDAPLAEIWPQLPGHAPDLLHFRPLPVSPDERYVATERCPWRGRLLQGEVHDDNCWVMGGVAGHAGLFGTLEAVHSLGRHFLKALRGEETDLGISAARFKAWTEPRWLHSRGSYLLGWDSPSPGYSSSGSHFSRHSIGHLGFTGTSLWMDPEADLLMVLLSNRVSPTRENPRLRPYRPLIHDLAWKLIHQE